MNCAVITIGDELLSGRVNDTNSSYITRELESIGLDTAFHVTVGDDSSHIQSVLRFTLEQCRAAIITGGLGPTTDDLTREAVAEGLGLSLAFHETVANLIRQRFQWMDREMSESNLRQAYVIEGAEIIDPVMGTAPGQILHLPGGKLVAMVPGVPAEMREMLERAVLPSLRAMGEHGQVRLQRSFRILGSTESEVAEKVERALAGVPGLKLAYLASFSGIDVRVTAMAEDRLEAEGNLAEADARIRAELTLMVASSDDESIEQVLGQLLRKRGLTLAFAESYTGGLLGEMITRVPGSSEYFLGSIVSYGNRAKQDLLGVDGKLLETEGAVSANTASAMARGARRAFNSDLALGVTGIAGPGGGSPEKPVGTIFIGLAAEGVEAVRKLKLPMGREAVRSISATLALALLRVYLLGGDFELFGDR